MRQACSASFARMEQIAPTYNSPCCTEECFEVAMEYCTALSTRHGKCLHATSSALHTVYILCSSLAHLCSLRILLLPNALSPISAPQGPRTLGSWLCGATTECTVTLRAQRTPHTSPPPGKGVLPELSHRIAAAADASAGASADASNAATRCDTATERQHWRRRRSTPKHSGG